MFDIVKTYISDYLFGFDKSQLDTSILKGKVMLKRVNLKPEKINNLLEDSLLPFKIKAGMVGSLELKIDGLSMKVWDIPVQVNINTLLLILGPSTYHMSSDDSFELVGEKEEDYNTENAYNFRQWHLKTKQTEHTHDDFRKIMEKK